MAKEQIFLQIKMYIAVTIHLESQMESEYINGKMEVFIKANLKKVTRMEKVNGRKFKTPQNAIDSKVTIALIKKMGSEHLLGRAEIFI
jgi:hypothetical protein